MEDILKEIILAFFEQIMPVKALLFRLIIAAYDSISPEIGNYWLEVIRCFPFMALLFVDFIISVLVVVHSDNYVHRFFFLINAFLVAGFIIFIV